LDLINNYIFEIAPSLVLVLQKLSMLVLMSLDLGD